tara:strand:- start:76 stop:654 length:579 start_codon:yes stop_codon:yes gene_type:complete
MNDSNTINKLQTDIKTFLNNIDIATSAKNLLTQRGDSIIKDLTEMEKMARGAIVGMLDEAKKSDKKDEEEKVEVTLNKAKKQEETIKMAFVAARAAVEEAAEEAEIAAEVMAAGARMRAANVLKEAFSSVEKRLKSKVIDTLGDKKEKERVSMVLSNIGSGRHRKRSKKQRKSTKRGKRGTRSKRSKPTKKR